MHAHTHTTSDTVTMQTVGMETGETSMRSGGGAEPLSKTQPDPPNQPSDNSLQTLSSSCPGGAGAAAPGAKTQETPRFSSEGMKTFRSER